MLKRWRKKSSEIMLQNPWWTYRRDYVEVPGYGQHEYHYAETNGSSMIVPLTATGQLVLVNQYRYLGERESLEFPCGGVKATHTHEQTAHFELAEETGYKAARLELLGDFNPWNGAAKETCQVYLATELTPTQAQADPTEDIECYQCTPSELDQLIRQRRIWDGMTLASWLLARETVLEFVSKIPSRQY